MTFFECWKIPWLWGKLIIKITKVVELAPRQDRTWKTQPKHLETTAKWIRTWVKTGCPNFFWRCFPRFSQNSPSFAVLIVYFVVRSRPNGEPYHARWARCTRNLLGRHCRTPVCFFRLQIASRTETDLIWLVVEPTPLKNMTSSIWWESHKTCSKPPTSYESS